MSLEAARDAVRWFQAIMELVARTPVRTPYELAKRLEMPLSSAYAAVRQLEGMACLARDEGGFLLVGPRAHQMALDALGYAVAGQRLVPLVRYARDLSGETVFTASLAQHLRVGSVALGVRARHVTLHPFQAYRVIGTPAWRANDALVCLQLEDADAPSGGARIQALAMKLGVERRGAGAGAMLICIALEPGASPDLEGGARLLLEVRQLLAAPAASS